MSTEKHLTVSKSRRIPRTGSGFTFLRLFGIALEVGGALISIPACIGFVVILVRLAPDFAAIVQHPESQMAGFVLILYLVWLLVPLALVLLGVVGFGLGYVLHRIATRPATVD